MEPLTPAGPNRAPGFGLFGRLEFAGKQIFVGIRSVTQLRRLVEGVGSLRAGLQLARFLQRDLRFGVEIEVRIRVSLLWRHELVLG